MGAATNGPSAVHKFPITIADAPALIVAHASAKPVHLAIQGDSLMLWMVVPVGAVGEKVERRFEVYGTGHPIPAKREHVGSVIDGAFVWHVFEAVA